VSIKIKDKARKVYLVIGCHGTATSLVIRGLRRCGVNIGNRLIARVYENMRFQRLNNWILKRAGGTWYDPPSEEAIMAVMADERIRAVMKDYEDEPMWGFKDPRTSLTGKHYLSHLGDVDAYLFCCFRKPDRLLASLKRKTTGLFDEQFAEEHIDKDLIDRYNQSIISLIQEFCEL
jgi:hypothetical protein